MKEPPAPFGIPLPFLSGRQVYCKPYPTEEERKQWRKFELVAEIALCALFTAVASWFGLFSDPSVFDPPKFTSFSIISREEVSPTSFIITLRPELYVLKPKLANSDPYAKEWEKGTWSVEFKQPQLQIARSYTPLPPREDDPPGDLRFLIREEANGEMSRYLGRLAVGEKVELRGPHTELEFPSDITDVLFLAGGTGIAPALQVAHTLLEVRRKSEKLPNIHIPGHGSLSPGTLPNIHIVWANRRREDCVGGTDLRPIVPTEREEGPIVQELRNLKDKYPDNVTVDYLVDEEGKTLDRRMISDLTRRPSRVTPQPLHLRVDSKLLFVSGPEGFVNFLAGPKKYWDGKQLQGELGGLIGKMGIRDWKVWKQ